MSDKILLEHYIDPSDWPTFVRRAFLLTLPLSGPLYVASIIILFVLAAAVAPFLMAASWAIDFWKGES